MPLYMTITARVEAEKNTRGKQVKAEKRSVCVRSLADTANAALMLEALPKTKTWERYVSRLAECNVFGLNLPSHEGIQAAMLASLQGIPLDSWVKKFREEDSISKLLQSTFPDVSLILDLTDEQKEKIVNQVLRETRFFFKSTGRQAFPYVLAYHPSRKMIQDLNLPGLDEKLNQKKREFVTESMERMLRVYAEPEPETVELTVDFDELED